MTLIAAFCYCGVVETKLEGASAAFSRMLTGQNLFLTDFSYQNSTGKGTVGLGTDFPSKILKLDLSDFPNSTLICQKGAYLASNPTVNIEMEFTKSLTAGIFGGQGFVLQKLSGTGHVLVKGGGTVVKKTLQENETLRVTSGSLVAFENTIDYDVQIVPGVKNAMFGGEGLFLTTLRGPGKVWLQGMPPDRMIAEIARRVPSDPDTGLGVPIGEGGSGSGEATSATPVDGADGAAGVNDVAESATGEGMVAATDAAVEADRTSTVASSGLSDVDSESQTALFGDAAPDAPKDESGGPFGDDSATTTTFSSDSSTTNTDFSDDFTSNEKTFQDDSSFSTDSDFGNASNDGVEDGVLFSDAASSAGETASKEGGGLLQALRDMFNRGDGGDDDDYDYD